MFLIQFYLDKKEIQLRIYRTIYLVNDTEH